MTPATTWTEKRNLSLARPARKETLIYILGRLSRGEKLPPEVLVLLAEQLWSDRDSTEH